MKPYLIFYYITLLLHFVLSFFSDGRMWGFYHWAHFPLIIKLGIFIIGILLPLVIVKLDTEKLSNQVKSTRVYIVIITCITFLFSITFYFLRARTFFDGDGYQIISYMATGNQIDIKMRYLVMWSFIKYIYDLIGNIGEAGVIIAFQVVSISMGMILIISVAIIARRLIDEPLDQIIFLLGLVTCGNMLYYFGHVEYYAIFILSFTLYTLLGVGVWRGLWSKWWVLAVQVVVIVSHIFGFILIPATVIILTKKSWKSGVLSRISTRIRYSIIAVIVLIISSGFAYKFSTDIFFQLAFVPVVELRLTQDGYTIFSGKHILDIISLILTLFPGLLIFLVVLFNQKFRSLLQNNECRWLLLLSVLSLGTTFFIDPKLGMVRDWDLFAFSMTPSAVFIYYILLSKNFKLVFRRKIAILMSCISILLLFSRAYADANPMIAVSQFKYQLNLDKTRSRHSWIHLVNYYKDNGDHIAAENVVNEWNSKYPEKRMMVAANNLYYKEHKLNETVRLLYSILEINPTYSDAYDFLGVCYIDYKQYDSAITLLHLANGLNPQKATTITNLATAYYMKKDFDNALSLYNQAILLDTSNYIIYYGMAKTYKDLMKYNEYLHCLELSATRENTHPTVVQELLEQNLLGRDLNSAIYLYQHNPIIMSDSQFILRMRLKFPSFDSALLKL